MIIAMINSTVKDPPIKAPQISPFRFFLFANLKNMKVNNAPINSGIKSCIFLFSSLFIFKFLQ